MSGSSSVAERQLPKLNVAGSIPVSRSNIFSNAKVQYQFVPVSLFLSDKLGFLSCPFIAVL